MHTHVDIDQKPRPIVYADQRKQKIIVMFAGPGGELTPDDLRLHNEAGELMDTPKQLTGGITLIDVKRMRPGRYFLSMDGVDISPIRVVLF